jgi:hypothetical protein
MQNTKTFNKINTLQDYTVTVMDFGGNKEKYNSWVDNGLNKLNDKIFEMNKTLNYYQLFINKMNKKQYVTFAIDDSKLANSGFNSEDKKVKREEKVVERVLIPTLIDMIK